MQSAGIAEGRGLQGSGPIGAENPYFRSDMARKIPGIVVGSATGNRSKFDESPGMWVSGTIGACVSGGKVSAPCKRDKEMQTHSDLLSLDCLPIYSFEPSMHLDILSGTIQVPQPLREISSQQPSN